MRGQRGFSLPEVLAALLILTFVITVSFTAFLERNRRLEQASEIMIAYQALANEAEYRRRLGYDHVKPDIDFMSDKTMLAPLAPYEIEITVVEVKPDVKNMTMTIWWRNRARVARLMLVRVDTGGTRLW
ncbi:MAG TPA: type II secretion system protein [Thermoanaerobaculia bacterium]|jgi:prepilin-type N-terminal cleavage/methylation domain-containing protein